jgi:uncharacterized DUF497 family protein
VKFEWDEKKSETNLKRRGFGFEIIERFDWNFALGPDVQIVDFETRELWIGPVGNRLYAVVLSARAEVYRVVSLRLATNNEIRLWREEFQNG